MEDSNLPLISILTPAYNAELYIGQAIRSILSQTYSNFELLVCDDCSTDKTFDKINELSNEDSRIKVFKNEKNLGYLKTCNILFEKASGDYITFQDSDDFSEPNRIELLLEEFKKDKELQVCGSQFNFLLDDGTKLPDQSPKYPLSHKEIRNHFFTDPPFCGASVMITKKMYDEFGGYNEYWDRIGAEDHYWLYLITEKYKSKNISNVLYYYRHNPNSVTRNKTNARKMHCHDFLMHFFNQRKNTGTDDIEKNNIEGILKMENSFIQPYIADPTLVYQRLADWSYTDKNYQEVFYHIFSAIKKFPFNLYLYKTLFYYFKKIYLKK